LGWRGHLFFLLAGNFSIIVLFFRIDEHLRILPAQDLWLSSGHQLKVLKLS
jgi:hypothetical protein